jgi:uncharacterized coiled-coil DUF342 family protein
MNEDLKKLIEEGEKIQDKINELHQEIFNNPDIPQYLKNGIKEIDDKFKKIEFKKYLDENKHRKIIGYNTETFMPIYE